MKRAFLTLLLMLYAFNAMSTEEPKYEVILSEDRYEIRQYEPMIVAEVLVSGAMNDVSNLGFRLLADYIFGNNIAVSEEESLKESVSVKRSEKIEMTAPVTREQNSDSEWIVAFVMPDKWTLTTLPKPNNPQVKIREIPSKTMATVRFSGTGRESVHRDKQSQLESWLSTKGYVVIGNAQFAGYNPPWTLPPFRRNEVIIPVSLMGNNGSLTSG